MIFPKIPYQKQWVRCPCCGSRMKQNLFDNTANCSGIYTKCKKCKREFEIKIKDGIQE